MHCFSLWYLEMKRMQQKSTDQLERIFNEHEQSKSRLEAQRKELELREKDLKEREELNETEERKLELEKKMVLNIFFEFCV